MTHTSKLKKSLKPKNPILIIKRIKPSISQNQFMISKNQNPNPKQEKHPFKKDNTNLTHLNQNQKEGMPFCWIKMHFIRDLSNNNEKMTKNSSVMSSKKKK